MVNMVHIILFYHNTKKIAEKKRMQVSLTLQDLVQTQVII